MGKKSLLVIWVVMIGATSFAIGHAWGIAAQLIFAVASFVLSFTLGALVVFLTNQN